jgi:GNAT superfamily N-acetyltransferase
MKLVRTENVEPENRGWVVDKITAEHLGEKVGYLKIEYIPQVEYDRWYPHALDYMVHIHGWCCGQRGAPDVIATMTLDKFKSLAWYCWKKEYPELTEGSELDHLVQQLESEVKERYSDKIATFKKQQVDNPKVAWVKVDVKHRRKGVATALYLEASKWMKEKGLTFRSSTIQSKSAIKLWESFVAQGIAKKSGDVYVIK